MNAFIQNAARNWKTTASGIVTFILSIPILYSAIENYAEHKPVDWRNVLIMAALWAVSHGLIQAKDNTTHSTVAEVQTATKEAARAS
jgi:hypothetical protein